MRGGHRVRGVGRGRGDRARDFARGGAVGQAGRQVW